MCKYFKFSIYWYNLITWRIEGISSNRIKRISSESSVIDRPIHEIIIITRKSIEPKSSNIFLPTCYARRRKAFQRNRRLLTIEECNKRNPRQRNHSDRRIEMWENESQAPSSDHTATRARRTRLHNRRRSRTCNAEFLAVPLTRHAERSSAFCRIFPTVATLTRLGSVSPIVNSATGYGPPYLHLSRTFRL